MQFRMPLTIYQNGITKPAVLFFDGLKRKEIFISWSDVTNVTLNETHLPGNHWKWLEITFRTKDWRGGGKQYGCEKDATFPLDRTNMSCPFAVLKHLRNCIPDRMHSECHELLQDYAEWEGLGPEEIRKEEDAIANFLQNRNIAFILGVVLLNISISIQILPVFSEIRSSGGSWILFHVIILYFAFWALGGGLLFDRKYQANLMLHKAEFTPDGIHIPNTLPSFILGTPDEIIPTNSIRVVRMELNPRNFTPISEVELYDRVNLRLPFSIYSSLREDPDFIEKDQQLIDMEISSSTPLSQSRLILGKVCLIMSFLLPTIFLAGFLPAYGLFRTLPPLLIVCVVLIAAIMILFRDPLGKEFGRMIYHLGSEVTISANSIIFNDRNGNSRTIQRESILNMEVVDGFVSPRIRVFTKSDICHLPLPVVAQLIDHGYHVNGVVDSDQMNDPSWIDPNGDGSKQSIYLEPMKLVRRDRRYHSILGTFLLIIGVILIFLLPPLFTERSPGIQIPICFGVSLGFPILAYGVIMLFISRDRIPTVFGQDGIKLSGAMRWITDPEIPYGAFPSAIPPSYLDTRRSKISFETGLSLTLGWAWQGLERHLQFINRQISAQKKLGGTHHVRFSARIFYKQTYYLGICLMIGFGLSSILIIPSSSEEPLNWIDDVWPFSLFLGSILTLFIFVLINYNFENSERYVIRHGENAHIDRKFMALVIVFLLTGITVGTALEEPIVFPAQFTQDPFPLTSKYSGGIIENESFTLVDNIVVKENSRLTIRDSIIIVQVGLRKGVGIHVAKGGVLVIHNSTIKGSTQFGYQFEIYGKATLTNSTFSGLADPRYHEDYDGDGGIEIYSDDVRIENCVIRDNLVNGIMIGVVSTEIVNCTFVNNGDDAIEVHGTGVRIEGCTFRENKYAIFAAEGSESSIRKCTFVNNFRGIKLGSSAITIRDCHFQNNSIYAIAARLGYRKNVEDSTFRNNTYDAKTIVELTPNFVFAIFSFTILVIGLIMAAILFVMVEQETKEEPLLTLNEIDRLYRKREKFR